MKKQIISCILTLILVLTGLPLTGLTVFADAPAVRRNVIHAGSHGFRYGNTRAIDANGVVWTWNGSITPIREVDNAVSLVSGFTMNGIILNNGNLVVNLDNVLAQDVVAAHNSWETDFNLHIMRSDGSIWAQIWDDEWANYEFVPTAELGTTGRLLILEHYPNIREYLPATIRNDAAAVTSRRTPGPGMEGMAILADGSLWGCAQFI